MKCFCESIYCNHSMGHEPCYNEATVPFEYIEAICTDCARVALTTGGAVYIRIVARLVYVGQRPDENIVVPKEFEKFALLNAAELAGYISYENAKAKREELLEEWSE